MSSNRSMLFPLAFEIKVFKTTGEVLLTTKAYNSRCITEWLAYELLEATRNPRLRLQDDRIPAISICLCPGLFNQDRSFESYFPRTCSFVEKNH